MTIKIIDTDLGWAYPVLQHQNDNSSHLKVSKGFMSHGWFLLYHFSVCSAQDKKWAGSVLHCSQSSLRMYQAFPYLWVVLNCSLHFAKVDLAISSVQMSQFPHMAYNISNWENSFTGILQKVQALNRCYWKRRYSDLQRTEMHSENDRMKLAINADREEVETQVMWPGGLGM